MLFVQPHSMLGMSHAAVHLILCTLPRELYLSPFQRETNQIPRREGTCLRCRLQLMRRRSGDLNSGWLTPEALAELASPVLLPSHGMSLWSGALFHEVQFYSTGWDPAHHWGTFPTCCGSRELDQEQGRKESLGATGGREDNGSVPPRGGGREMGKKGNACKR